MCVSDLALSSLFSSWQFFRNNIFVLQVLLAFVNTELGECSRRGMEGEVRASDFGCSMKLQNAKIEKSRPTFPVCASIVLFASASPQDGVHPGIFQAFHTLTVNTRSPCLCRDISDHSSGLLAATARNYEALIRSVHP